MSIRRSGFSLMELLIVVVCLAIMALIVLPGANSNQVTTLRLAARLLVADLEYAQLESIGKGDDPYVVVFHLPVNEYFIARSSDPSTPVLDPGSHLTYITRFGEGRAANLTGAIIDSIEVGGDDLLGFTALGVLDQGSDAMITLRCGSSTLQVRVDADTGEPIVE